MKAVSSNRLKWMRPAAPRWKTTRATPRQRSIRSPQRPLQRSILIDEVQHVGPATVQPLFLEERWKSPLNTSKFPCLATNVDPQKLPVTAVGAACSSH